MLGSLCEKGHRCLSSSTLTFLLCVYSTQWKLMWLTVAAPDGTYCVDAFNCVLRNL